MSGKQMEGGLCSLTNRSAVLGCLASGGFLSGRGLYKDPSGLLCSYSSLPKHLYFITCKKQPAYSTRIVDYKDFKSLHAIKVPKRTFLSFQILSSYPETMSSVNSAACLLATNHFYQNSSPNNTIQPVYSFSCSLSQARQRQVTTFKTASSHQGLSEQEPKRWILSLVWKSPSSSPASTKQLGPAGRGIK